MKIEVVSCVLKILLGLTKIDPSAYVPVSFRPNINFAFPIPSCLRDRTSNLLVLRSFHVISLEKQRYNIRGSGRSIRRESGLSSMLNRQSQSLV